MCIRDRSAELLLTNEDTGFEPLDTNPIETYADSESTATSTLFKNNRSILKVNHADNGFTSGDNSYVYFRGSIDVGGITSTELNDNLYLVTNSGIDSYNITSVNKATTNSFGGGSGILASYNRKYEKLYALVPNLSFGQTTLESSVKTTNISPVDDDLLTFTSYSQTDYEKTFLNEDFYFINQKVLASRINETSNNIDRSLTYKLTFKSDVSHLSPLIDLSRASLKTISNRIESAKGKEDRFGRRDQILEFYPVWTFTVTNSTATAITTDQRVSGITTNASGTILKVDGTRLTVRVDTVNVFTQGEGLKFSAQTQSALNPDTTGANAGVPKVVVTADPVTEIVPVIPNETSPVSTVYVRDSTQIAENYDNKISGAVVLWNKDNKVLTVINDKRPINDDYTSKSGGDDLLKRVAVGVTPGQSDDIFRVDDIIGWTGQEAGTESYVQISKITYSDGVDYVSDIQSKDTSNIATYVTKEVSIDSPGTVSYTHLTLPTKA